MWRAMVVVLTLMASGLPAQPADRVTELIKRLGNPDPGHRYSAVIELGHYKGSRVVKALEGQLEDPEDYIRVAAIQSLRQMGSLRSIPALIERLGDEDYFVRVAATGSLRALTGAQLGFDPDAADPVRARIHHAWRAWWDRNKSRLLPADVGTDDKDARPERAPARTAPARVDPGRRYSETLELTRQGLQALHALQERLDDPEDYIRVAAIQGLRKIRSQASIPHIVNRLEDRDYFVRVSAVGALRELSGENFGFDPHLSAEARKASVDAWRTWWAARKMK